MQTAKSIIISCAGIGSRLGLSTTKALININGKSLIRWQLELFKDIEDIRVVIGFQAKDVVNEVLKYRKDAIFVYNHNYFETKTGASFYLGAKDANEYVIEYDGDLLVHSEDMKMLLELEGEYICFSDKNSEDGIYLNVDENSNVISFSKSKGDFEWTGPACIKKEKVKYSSANVYNQLEEYLPIRGIKIRSCDIDTYDDYKRAINILSQWYK